MKQVGRISNPCATLLWAGLTPDTRKGYNAAIRSYETYCALIGIQVPWPAQEYTLGEWITGRLFGSTSPKQGQVKPKTAEVYLSALRSYHVDQRMPSEVFDSPWIQRIVKGGHRLFPGSKRQRLPITKEILDKVTANPSRSADDLNYNTAFKVAWAGFLRVGEFTHTLQDRHNRTFHQTGLTRSDITFAENDEHVVLRLKRSKTDVNHTGVEIILAATDSPTCPVKALRQLFDKDPQAPHAPLFSLREAPFTRKSVIDFLHRQLLAAGIPTTGYSGHSFRKGAAQHASDNGMLDEQIKTLGRWSSNAFQLYFQSSTPTLYALNKRFQTGRAPAIALTTGRAPPNSLNTAAP